MDPAADPAAQTQITQQPFSVQKAHAQKVKIWTCCRDAIQSFAKELKENDLKVSDLQGRIEEFQFQINLEEKFLREIDPGLLGESRYNVQDWFFQKCVKSIYYFVLKVLKVPIMISCWRNITRAQENLKTAEEQKIQSETELNEKKQVERELVSQFKQAFTFLESIPLSTADRISAKFSWLLQELSPKDKNINEYIKETNHFLDACQKMALPLSTIVDRFEEAEEDSVDEAYLSYSDSEYFSYSDSEDSSSEEDPKPVKSVENPESPKPCTPSSFTPSNLTIDKLIPNLDQLAALNKILPLDHIQSIDTLDDGNYTLKLETSFEGRFDVKFDDPIFRDSLKGAILGVSQMNPIKNEGPIAPIFIKAGYTKFSEFLILDDVGSIWPAIKDTHFVLGKEIKVGINEGMVTIFEDGMRLGICETDIALIRQKLLSIPVNILLKIPLYKMGFEDFWGNTTRHHVGTVRVCQLDYLPDSKGLSIRLDNSLEQIKFGSDNPFPIEIKNVNDHSLPAEALNFLLQYVKWIPIEKK